jgi:hypothetical protein
MLIALLLQTRTSTIEITSLTNVYLALLGTFIAAASATIASLVASSRAADATKEVGALSRKTTQEVAVLSAQVSKESATLAAQTARDIKDIDYKQAFYKMIIERRLKVWEEAEKLFTELEPTIKYRGENEGESFRYFTSSAAFEGVYEKMRALGVKQQLWMDKKYNDMYVIFFNKHVIIRKEAAVNSNNAGRAIIDDELLKVAGQKYFNELDSMQTSLFSMLNDQLADLHEVEKFVTRYRA